MYVVTGATGQLGHLVVEHLLEEVEAMEVTAIGRDAAKAADLVARGVKFAQADYNRPDTLPDALRGAKRLLLISSSEVGQRIAQHQAVIDAARAARVEMIAYTSILHAGSSPVGLAVEHRETEAALRASGLPFVLLRNGWYSENYALAIPAALEHGLIGCAGDGRISVATRSDYAAAAAKALLDGTFGGDVYELAGDMSFTMTELAGEISKQSGKAVSYTNLSQADHEAALTAAGLPQPVAAMLADADAAIAKGALFDGSHTLSRLIGRPTTPISGTVSEVLAGLGGQGRAGAGRGGHDRRGRTGRAVNATRRRLLLTSGAVLGTVPFARVSLAAQSEGEETPPRVVLADSRFADSMPAVARGRQGRHPRRSRVPRLPVAGVEPKYDPRVLGEQPSNRDLRRRRLIAGRDLAEQIDQRLVCLSRRGREARDDNCFTAPATSSIGTLGSTRCW